MSRDIFQKNDSADLFADPCVSGGQLFFTLFDDVIYSDQEKPRQQRPNQKDQNEGKNKKKMIKIDKGNIRTNRNSQKIYHNILKNWLSENGCEQMIQKYAQNFNQRVYFILILNQIQKQIDGRKFAQAYRHLAQEVIYKKRKEMKQAYNKKPDCEQGHHLQRVIDQIHYSIKACQAFMNGNIYKSLEIVYKRNQSNITIVKRFDQALRIFHNIAGYWAEDMSSDYQL